MGIFDFLPNLFERQKFKDLNQAQVEGLLDVLVYAMVSDGITAEAERDELSRAAGMLSWNGSGSIEEYLQRAEIRLKEAETPPAFLRTATAALNEDWMREEAYYLAARMAGADDEVVAAETEFLHQLTQAFELEREQLRLITRRLIDEKHI